LHVRSMASSPRVPLMCSQKNWSPTSFNAWTPTISSPALPSAASGDVWWAARPSGEIWPLHDGPSPSATYATTPTVGRCSSSIETGRPSSLPPHASCLLSIDSAIHPSAAVLSFLGGPDRVPLCSRSSDVGEWAAFAGRSWVSDGSEHVRRSPRPASRSVAAPGASNAILEVPCPSSPTQAAFLLPLA